MTEVAAKYESSTSFDLPMFVGARLFFMTFFSKLFWEIYFWKNLLTYLVIPSGNSHLLSSALEMNITFLWMTEFSSSLSDTEEEVDDWQGEEDLFWFFPLSSLIFSFSRLWSLYTVSVYCQMALVNRYFYLLSHLLPLPLYFTQKHLSPKL